jgi:ankyrin repeat protein
MKLAQITVAAFLAASSGLATDTAAANRLLILIRNNDLVSLKAAIAQGVGVNARADRNTTPLMYAAAFGSLDSLQVLQAAGADVNAQNAFGATALMWAVTEPAKVRLLLEHGADVNAKSSTGRTALLIAALHNGSDGVVDLLIAKGADMHAGDNRGLTFLLAASAACNSRQVRIAVSNGLDVNAKDASLGFTPLMNAAGNGDLESVKLLIAKGARVNDVSAQDPIVVLRGPIDLGYYTPLMLASLYGPPAIVDTLLRAGAKVDAKDIRGRTALHYAVSTEAQNPEIVESLLQAGLDPAAKDLTGQSVVDWASKYAHPAVLRLLGGSPAAPLEHASASNPAAATRQIATRQISTRAAVERSLHLLETVSGSFMKNGGCVACHAQNLTALAAKFAKAHAFGVDEPGLQAQLGELKAAYLKTGDRLLQRYDGGGAIDTLDYAMLHFEAADYPPDSITDAIVYNMVSEQMADGSWIRGGALQRAGPSPAARAPMQDSDIVRTAMAVRALKTYGWEGRRADLTSHVDAARLWLLRAKPVYNEESAMQILGLFWAGETAGTIQGLGRKLIGQQGPGGGWSQNPWLPEDSYATGQTLFALSEAGIIGAADPVYRRGVQFLLRTQREDGSWYVKSRAPKLQPYFQSGFPYDHDQWISMAGTAWAAIALAIASPPPAAL